jgi:hypothetical protein
LVGDIQDQAEGDGNAGITTHGFSSFLAALEKVPPAEPITMSAFEGVEWFGFFGLNRAGELVGFALVAKRTPVEEQERLNWFLRHLA